MKERIFSKLKGLIIATVFATFAVLPSLMLTSCSAMPSFTQPVTSFQTPELSAVVSAQSGQALEDFELTIPLKRYFGVSAGPAWLGATNADELVKEALSAEIRRQGGSQAANVTIAYEARLTDLMLNGFTGFIYAPTTVRVSGTVLR
jgi:hypothetical protein